MRAIILFFLFWCSSSILLAQSDIVSVEGNQSGHRLKVNGKDFMINGMNWDYFPIGTNYEYSLWNQSDSFIKEALDAEMGLLQNMGVNSIRVYSGIPKKWIEYIYDNYGIYTMLNHSFGRYGLTIDGVWTPITVYNDKKTKELLMSEVIKMAEDYKNTRGLLLFLLGNENNYGLFWAGAETEDFPDEEDKKREVGEKRGRPMYQLMNEASKAIKAINPNLPVAICNGDLLFLEIVAQECPDVDIYGTNVYRGKSFGDLFERVKKEYGKPVLLTEFGSDAFNAKTIEEDQQAQAFYAKSNWKEIYENAAGLGKAGNSIGGYTFQFSDGWWKSGQTKNLDRHDSNASWSNGGYQFDFVEGQNNMNEEWFGICAKGPTNAKGFYTLYPRAAYYTLKEVHAFNPFNGNKNLSDVNNHFNNILLVDATLKARGDKAALKSNSSEKIRISRLSAEFTTFNTGGSLLTTPESADPTKNTYPNQLGFDHMQSYFIGVEGKPASNMRAEVTFNVLGNVAENPIDEIFYENVGRRQTFVGVDGGDETDVVVNDPQRLRVYQAEFEWNEKEFDLKGFYRTGHYHWGYEGDFFGLYPEANYGPNLDIYNGEISGIELETKGAFKGFKLAAGPQLWWGANPGALLKYQRSFGHWNVTGMYHRDFNTNVRFDETGRRVINQNQVRSGVIPPWATERATLAVERKFGKIGVTVGGIWGGNPLVGSTYQDINEAGEVVADKINSNDTWGGKFKLTYQGGKFNWYGQGSYMGLVAGGGADQTQTFTGWKLKDSGSGNMVNLLSGLTYSFGKFQVAPNFMYQSPLVAAMPNNYGGPARLRNFIDDPFAVRNGNREMYGYELLLTYDPTPGSWMYQWDNDRAEDAKFAMNLGFVYKRLPTQMDAHIGFLADRSFFAFSNSTKAVDLWEVNSRMVSKISPELGLIANFYVGNGQANGFDNADRVISRFGFDLRTLYKKWKFMYALKINDWGPFDYHRDFNLTYPIQTMLDVSLSLGKPDWFILPNTRIGVRGTWRGLDQYSPRYAPMATEEFSNEPVLSPVGFSNGTEWEFRTYIQINIGK
ncbi:glycosidase [Flavobacterium sp.]|uniref:glycosidase n=1 Tax=Flavobacterium sp. TaxID=239 RepID=UPI003526E0DA